MTTLNQKPRLSAGCKTPDTSGACEGQTTLLSRSTLALRLRSPADGGVQDRPWSGRGPLMPILALTLLVSELRHCADDIGWRWRLQDAWVSRGKIVN